MTDDYNELMNSLFDNKFELSNGFISAECDEDESSDSDPNFEDEYFGMVLDQLRVVEYHLNEVKERVGNISRKRNVAAKWRSHTTFTHTLKELPKHFLSAFQEQHSCNVQDDSLYTQAYCKFMELLMFYPQLLTNSEPLKSFHLCEAPGAFVCALRDFLQQSGREWQWWMNSLNVYNEWSDPNGMLLCDSFIVSHLSQLIFSENDTGNVLEWTESFIQKVIRKCGGKFELITADGSIDCCENPRGQEESVCALIAQEVRIALNCLAPGGNFVLKAFTFFHRETIERILLPLIRNFQRVVCYKPASSKPGNSEVYLICFDRIDAIRIQGQNCNKLTTHEMQKIKKCAEFFATRQSRFMEYNLSSFCNLSKSQRAAIAIKKYELNEHLSRAFLEHIPRNSARQNTEIVQSLNANPWLESCWLSDAPTTVTTESCVVKMDSQMETAFQNFIDRISNDFSFEENEFLVFAKPKLSAISRVRHSLFANKKLLQLNFEKVLDLCQTTAPDSTFHFERSGNEVLVRCWELLKANWIEVLQECVYGSVSVLKIKMYSNTVLLSRFSASILFLLSCIFERVELQCEEIRCNDSILLDVRQRAALDRLLQGLKEQSLQNDLDLLAFVPLTCFACVNFIFPIIAFNNNKLLI